MCHHQVGAKNSSLCQLFSPLLARSGESGAGKTVAAKFIFTYIAKVGHPPAAPLSAMV